MEATLTKATNEEREAIKKWRLNGKSGSGSYLSKKYFTFSYKGQAYDFVSNGRKLVSYPLTMEIRPYK